MDKLITGKAAFGFVLILVTALGILHLHWSQSKFEKSCDSVANTHKETCDMLRISTASTVHRDSVLVVDYDLLNAMQSEQSQIKSLLELEHGKIQNDFTTLSLWASVLMIAFLVFSIYSMYRIDELHRQGRDYVSKIIELSSEAKGEIKKVDELFEDESDKLKKQSHHQLENLKTAYDDRLKTMDQTIAGKIKQSEDKISSNIDEYNTSIDEKSNNVLLQFQRLEESLKELRKILDDMKDPEDK